MLSMIRNHLIRAAFLGLWLLPQTMRAQASGDESEVASEFKIVMCNASRIQASCAAANFTRNDLAIQVENERCLNHRMACGQYSYVLRELEMATSGGALPPTLQYFYGMALYRSQIQTRSEGLRCVLRSMAKDNLEMFLEQAKAGFRGSNFGTISMSYIRDASNTLANLLKPSTCPEAALSELAIRSIARRTAREKLKNVFDNVQVSDTGSGDAVSTELNTIFSTLRGVTSTASEIEAATSLLTTEVEANKKRLKDTADAFARSFFSKEELAAQPLAVDMEKGSITFPSQAANFDLTLKRAADFLTMANLLKAEQERVIADLPNLLFKDCENGQTACSSASVGNEVKDSNAAYNALRTKYSGLAFAWLQETNLQTQIFRGLFSSSPGFNGLIGDLKKAENPNSPGNTLKQLKQTMKQSQSFGSICQTINASKWWYCKP